MSALRYKLSTAFALAISSILAHKLRSFLTLLGVIIGVSSVVLVGAAIEGLGNYANQTTSKAFGSETYLIAQIANVGKMTRKERAEKLRVNKEIRPEDLAYLRATTGNQILYSPYRNRNEDVKYKEQVFEGASIIGTAASLPEIRDVITTEGRFFSEQEEQNRQFVCVIGTDIQQKFFEGASPIGKSIIIRGYAFLIVGLQEKLGNANGRSQDGSVYIPDAAFTRIIGPSRSISIFARPRPESGLTLDQGLDITRAALRTRFKTRPGAVDNFDFLTPDSIRAFIDQILGLIGVVIVPVTMISLVVGGIVIMNIMLVSVTERTREIGIRKSLGARQSDILLQFLVEAVFLSLMGGIIGLSMGYLMARALSLVFGVDLEVTTFYVALSIIVSTVVGVISGWYPARRAARLDPIVALRAE
ncbi:MAG TPA: ABC transporter permease [Bryobacteraceae bacterium]|nr:ABC transporter permease [Bryobacteraceae bacterium]